MPEQLPRATYRLQLRPGFGFDEAADIVDYLAALGVSHVYTSPYLQAAPGSAHGYDVVDHSRVNHELGGEAGHQRLVEHLRHADLGQVIDIVPNHMAIGSADNRWWWDVLENGPSSRFADHFDVDWDATDAKLRNRVLMPILADHYGRVLEQGDIKLHWDDDGRFRVTYFDHQLPVSPRSLDRLMLHAAERLAIEDGADHLAFIGHSLGRLPSAVRSRPDDVNTRHRDKEVLYEQLIRLAADRSGVAAAVRAEVEAINGNVDLLDELLERQNYRLAFWRTAGHDVDYRRFFDIDTLIGLRAESAEVFADTHQLILQWLAHGEVQGLRVDHPDGLREPGAYFDLLRAAAPEAWIVIEKILEPGEQLPKAWPVDGTTGYDFCHVVTRLLHDPRGEAPIRHTYAEFITHGEPGPADEGAPPVGEPPPEDLDRVVHAAKLAVMRDSLAADLTRLTTLFEQVAEQHRRWRDFTRFELHEALVETAACYPVYRTYVGPSGECSDTDASIINQALAAATSNRADLDPEVFTFLGLVLRGELEAGRGPATELRLRFQQTTGPVMAKGVEDTAFYDYVPLGSLNEVGADPAVFALEPETVHGYLAEAAARRPRSMLTLTTHDTKRSEDVRARLALLSEIPGAWAEALHRWRHLAQAHRTAVEAPGWPDPRAEHLLFQTLVGAHPLGTERAVAYMAKASKEAKRHTSWTDPCAAYDSALRGFVEAVLADTTIMSDLAAFVDQLLEPGWINGLAQKLILLTAPGVPDLYQGTELWVLSLVDPDNRRPVDFARRQELLTAAADLTPEQRWAARVEGTPKLWLVHRALTLRADHPEWFHDNRYEPLAAQGPAATHAFAFIRGGRVISVVPRLPIGLDAAGGWGDTTIDLPPGQWYDELGERSWESGPIPVAELLARFPVALR